MDNRVSDGTHEGKRCDHQKILRSQRLWNGLQLVGLVRRFGALPEDSLVEVRWCPVCCETLEREPLPMANFDKRSGRMRCRMRDYMTGFCAAVMAMHRAGMADAVELALNEGGMQHEAFGSSPRLSEDDKTALRGARPHEVVEESLLALARRFEARRPGKALC